MWNAKLLIGALLLTCPSMETKHQETPPVDVFSDLDGTWKGEFVGYAPNGKELYRIEVKQTYKTVDDHTQVVHIEDKMPDGTVITGTGTNTARFTETGAFELRCVVKKSNGERVAHKGRLVRGPDGKKQLLWYSIGAKKTESFREMVDTSGARPVYIIEGMGRYGGTLMQMAGRYEKVEAG